MFAWRTEHGSEAFRAVPSHTVPSDQDCRPGLDRGGVASSRTPGSGADFAIDEIMTRARRETISRPLRARSFHVHLTQHCVANRPPNPGRWRILMESAPGRRRGCSGRVIRTIQLARVQGRLPEPGDLPPEYGSALDLVSTGVRAPVPEEPGAGSSAGAPRTGRALWSDEPADTYIKRLREGWE